MDGGGVRLNKYIADAGVCSRRAADRLIADGRVAVDGRPAETGERISPGQSVEVDGRSVGREEETVLLVFNKPPGLVCTAAEDEPDSVVRYIGYPKRIYPVGRLDKYSGGLLLLTNRGDLVNGVMRSRYGHEKEYVVTVDRPVTDGFIRCLEAGVPLEEGVTRRCRAEKLSRIKFRIVLTQGWNRQIRRMCEHFGYRAMSVTRVRILGITLDGLAPGEWRRATEREAEEVSRLSAD